MALFGKKNNGENGDNSKASDAPPPSEGFSPKKAAKFFSHAQTAFDSSNYEYAMQMWLRGLRWDPSSMDGFQGFMRAADGFLHDNPKGKVSKETRSVISEKGPIGKFMDAMLEFGIKKDDPNASLRAAVAASDLGLQEQGQFLGRYALSKVAADPKKQKKSSYVKLLDVLEKAEDYNTAAQAGEAAMRLDPSDGDLQARVRNMSAMATMRKGGFDDDSEGGFRKNIKDAGKQAELIAQESIAKTDSTKDDIVERTKAAFEERPDDLPSLEGYCKALLDRAKRGDELKAMTIFNKAHKDTGQFRYRQLSGDIQLRLMRRNVNGKKKIAKARPDDAEAKADLVAAVKSLREKELGELKLQVENYPTDLQLKYKLGRILAAKGEYDDAIAEFQQAQNDAKIREHVLLDMGHAFQALGGWDDAAIDTYRKALSDMREHDNDLGMELRYGLMTALQSKAEHDGDGELAGEAEKIASSIAIKSFSYKDIRQRREQIKALVKELNG